MKYFDKTGAEHRFLIMSFLADLCIQSEILKYVDLSNKMRDEGFVLNPIYPNKIFDNLEKYKKIYKINFPKLMIYRIIKEIL